MQETKRPFIAQPSGLKDLSSFSITYIALIIFLAAAIMAIDSLSEFNFVIVSGYG
jgi:hypothetical protein